MEGVVIVATRALLPEAGLAEVADADFGEGTSEELDPGEVGGERDEGAGDFLGAGPEAQGPALRGQDCVVRGRWRPRFDVRAGLPLCVWTALGVAYDGYLSSAGEGAQHM